MQNRSRGPDRTNRSRRGARALQRYADETELRARPGAQAKLRAAQVAERRAAAAALDKMHRERPRKPPGRE